MATRTRRNRRRRGRRIGLLDYWQNLLDHTYDFVDDTIDRARDDDRDELEDELEEVRRAVAELSAKLDRLLAATPGTLDVRDTATSAGGPAVSAPGAALIEGSALIGG